MDVVMAGKDYRVRPWLYPSRTLVSSLPTIILREVLRSRIIRHESRVLHVFCFLQGWYRMCPLVNFEMQSFVLL